ncbi:MAG TPA: aminopeptidase P family N-terminal domain-containing protein [Burkholderiales bacterium]|nr:aminopeptidase P family N-terminal domain-containing protein [Burkholderiales bacterium]
MRRGLISWSQDEVPASTLEARVSRLQAKMRDAGLDAVLIYTSFARPSAVSWLTHFVPYWNEGLLVVPSAGAPALLAAFSKRMRGWIRSVSHVGEVQSVSNLGRAAADFLERLPGTPSIGVLELDLLPWPVAEPLASSRHGKSLSDATPLFTAIRQPADDTEIALARRAADIAAKALGAISTGAAHAAPVLAAIERSARLDGAEEVLSRIAPNLAAGTALCRPEGDLALGARYAVELSVAYKATWVRVLQCFSPKAPQSWLDAQEWTSNWATGIAGVSGGSPPGAVAFWTLEACVGSQPFSIVGSAIGPRGKVAPGTLACFSIQLQLPEGPWLCGGPVVVGGSERGRLLA